MEPKHYLYLHLLLACLVSAFGFEQGKQPYLRVTGKISDDKGLPVAGCIIRAGGLGPYAKTDSNGVYVLELRERPGADSIIIHALTPGRRYHARAFISAKDGGDIRLDMLLEKAPQMGIRPPKIMPDPHDYISRLNLNLLKIRPVPAIANPASIGTIHIYDPNNRFR